MRGTIFIALIAVTGSGLAACDQVAGIVSDSSRGAIAACEAHVLSTLKAPTTYKRNKVEFVVGEPFNLSQYQNYERTKFCGFDESWMPCTETNNVLIGAAMKDIGDKLGYRKPTKKQIRQVENRYWQDRFAAYQARPMPVQLPASVIISYDAENSFGTPLRSYQVCKFGPKPQNLKYTRGDMYDGDETGRTALNS